MNLAEDLSTAALSAPGLLGIGSNERLLNKLRPRDRRGSKARCHLLTQGSRNDVAARLSLLAAPFGEVSDRDRWMPGGFQDVEEAQLHNAPNLLDLSKGAQLGSWWLARANANAMTPNFDIAATCTIDGVKGFLLVEAKAHVNELHDEEAGKALGNAASEGTRANHAQIGAAILQANDDLINVTGLPWAISRDHCYQMSNRFAWAWRLTHLGCPVILVYLGFVEAWEMADRGAAIRDDKHWEALVANHGGGVVPGAVWGKQWRFGGASFTPSIRSVSQPLREEI